MEISSAHIVGFSMGSGIAVDFVLAHPEMARSLVSVGPWIGGYSSEAARALSQDFAKMDSVFKTPGSAQVVDYALAQTFLANTIRDPETKGLVRAIVDDFTWWYFSRKDPVLRLKPAAFERLGEIAVSTLIVTAEYDVPVCREIADFLVREISNSQKVDMPGAGHFMMIDKPEAFNRVLMDFFAEATGRSPDAEVLK